MADINLQMTQRNAGNTAWDNLNPKTKAANVIMADASTVEDSVTTVEDSVTTVEDSVTTHLVESATIVIIKKNISILTTSWVNDTGTSGFWYYEIRDTDVTADSVVDVNVHLADLENASDVKPVTQSFAGTYRLYADAQPTVDLTADVRITNSIGGVA